MVAPLTLAADGGDPEEGYWLRADPVHMRIHRNQLVLCDTSVFAVSLDEARAFVESMNAHFNPEGLRYDDEFARHKALDAIGDLALAGMPILGCYRSYRGGHALNVKALQALFASQDAWELVEGAARQQPVHTAGPIADKAAAVAYSPDAS